MRTRIRTIVKKTYPALSRGLRTATIFGCSGQSSVYPDQADGPSPEIVLEARDEYMADGLGKDVPHSVVHRTSDQVLQPISGSVYPWLLSPYGAINYGVQHHYWMNWYSDNARAISRMRVAPTSDGRFDLPANWSIGFPSLDEDKIYSDLRDRAKQQKADHLLNLMEANEIWPSLKSLATDLPKLAFYWHKLTDRNLIRTASSAFLAWKFGIGPLLSDLSKTYQFSKSLNQSYHRYRSKPKHRISLKVMGEASYFRPDQISTANGRTWKQSSFQGLCTQIPVRRYVLVVKPNTPAYQSESFDKLDYVLSRFTSSPAQLAWERIPFSFIVDWFVDVRRALDKVDSAIGVEPFRVISFTRSSKWQVVTQQFCKIQTVCPTQYGIADQLLCTITDTHYERSLVSPGSLIRWSPRFGKSQAAITAALIGQQLSRLRSAR